LPGSSITIPSYSSYAEQYIVALLDRAFWTARPQDTMGLLFAYATVSGRLGNAQSVEQEFGLPYSNNATGIQTHEMILEVNYDIHVYSGVNFQPEFQYVIRPNAQANIPNAVVLGFKANIQF
jgi:porin